MPVSSKAVANAFLELAKKEAKQLTNMQLQKLVFIAQGYSLALLNKPLYYDTTHAWQWGPVIPKLYKELQQYGSGFVTRPIQAVDSVPSGSPESEIVQGVWDGFKQYSGAQLSTLTHRKGSPWSLTWEKDRFGIIPEEEIARYYQGTLNAA